VIEWIIFGISLAIMTTLLWIFIGLTPYLNVVGWTKVGYNKSTNIDIPVRTNLSRKVYKNELDMMLDVQGLPLLFFDRPIMHDDSILRNIVLVAADSVFYTEFEKGPVRTAVGTHTRRKFLHKGFPTWVTVITINVELFRSKPDVYGYKALNKLIKHEYTHAWLLKYTGDADRNHTLPIWKELRV